MIVAIPLYDRFTALDAIGPYEVLWRLPGVEVRFLGPETGLVHADTTMLGVEVTHAYEDVPHPEVVMVPGGTGTRALLEDERLLGWIRAAHEHSTWTTSVCTGSLLLGAAGVLEGLDATCHWAALDDLSRFGATPTSRRVVEQGKVITAAGVSSGIDMALTLAAKIAGEDEARAIQLRIEYDPEPPFDSGSVAKASPAVLELARTLSTRQLQGAGSAP